MKYISYTVTALFLDSWIVMLLLGAAHEQTGTVPALGYWTVFALFWIATMIVSVGIISAWFAIRDIWDQD